MKKSLLLAAVLAIGSSAWILSGQLGEQTAAPVKKQPAELNQTSALTKVRVATLKSQPRQTLLVINGWTKANRTVDLRAETVGPIIQLPIEKGQQVEQGDTLALIAVEDRKAKLESARAVLAQREIELTASKKLSKSGYTSETAYKEAQANYQAAAANVNLAEVELNRTKIRAPFAGILDQKYVELGDFVKAGDTVARVVELDPIKVNVPVSEADIDQVKMGTVGQIRLSNGATIAGAVTYISRSADGATRTFTVELSVPNKQAAVADGMTAELRLPLRSVKAHIVSPAILTLGDKGRIGVKTVGQDGRVRFQTVEIIEQDEQGLWIRGLPDEAQVITVGQDFVLDGQLVEAVDEELVAAQKPEQSFTESDNQMAKR
tara:strand:+ start:3559 stop:4689 length:1131 start_codon:yes stop_codon:yes gene_type:complete